MAHCKGCQNAYSKADYGKNRAVYLSKAKRSNRRRRDWFIEIKSSLSCSACGESHIATLDFHHVAGGKDFNLSSKIARGFSKATILAEMAKCIVLCANCHRKLHYNQRIAPAVGYGGLTTNQARDGSTPSGGSITAHVATTNCSSKAVEPG